MAAMTFRSGTDLIFHAGSAVLPLRP